jgi:hypothetical protein
MYMESTAFLKKIPVKIPHENLSPLSCVFIDRIIHQIHLGQNAWKTITSYTPLKNYNGTLSFARGVPLEIQGQQLPINELNGTPPLVACPISNLHRCKRRLSVKGKKGGDDGHKGIFVCGENFSENYQQWMEGSLETGARVVERIRAIGTQ